MGLGRNLLAQAAQRLDLPADVIVGLPRMELIGQQEFSMEPHGGLIAYSQTEILIKSALGTVAVCGKAMTVKLMNDQRIVISGMIKGVQLPEES